MRFRVPVRTDNHADRWNVPTAASQAQPPPERRRSPDGRAGWTPFTRRRGRPAWTTVTRGTRPPRSRGSIDGANVALLNPMADAPMASLSAYATILPRGSTSVALRNPITPVDLRVCCLRFGTLI